MRPTAPHPGDGLEAGDAAHGAVVLELDGVPVAVLRLDDRTLRDAVAPAAQGALQHDLGLVRPMDVLAAPDRRRTGLIPWPVDLQHVVVIADVVEMRAFGPEVPAFARGLDEEFGLRPGLDGAAVRLELDEIQVAVAPDHRPSCGTCTSSAGRSRRTGRNRCRRGTGASSPIGPCRRRSGRSGGCRCHRPR